MTYQTGKSPRKSPIKYNESNDGGVSQRSTFGGIDSRPDNFVKAIKKELKEPKEGLNTLSAFDTEV